jgi:hypothetical protein
MADVRRYVYYRNYAEELRVMAAAKRGGSAGEHLLSAAVVYDQLASSV